MKKEHFQFHRKIFVQYLKKPDRIGSTLYEKLPGLLNDWSFSRNEYIHLYLSSSSFNFRSTPALFYQKLFFWNLT
jgi:hypothetical protein